ncbi:lactosylceramide 4-alpha-galactosyltransferase-like isoform X1 [Bombus vancouverensis nearcticus]|uniref:Lactosylceramide 4-alpha-galactosyltransferase-like isoform X1 n=1 Tax=Bombus bifarius TaxID=103933 RepID=A0A6P8LR28_9HYME|nr:lactosylceramide 4-alpha-galactosyltransferase-like isoform X1 [Bombus vancouverensis nearcticus]XP_033297778.1 lactosylceramide 4-alpha-galactosyltransferase-like isoform X1 [Bombus bifarius]
MKKRFVLGFLCTIVIFILMISTDNDFIQHISPFVIGVWNDITCYEEEGAPDGLPDFDPQLDKPMTDRNIFFHETSCFDKDGLVLNARQACAVESAAKMNPSMNVYLLFISPSKISDQSREMFNQLQTYSNVRIRHIKPEKYMRDTPLHLWYSSGILKKSYWPRSHMSDILRYLTLWKYGGIYLDLDVVVIASLERLTNFAGAEDWKNVAAGVMGFDVTELGRRMADACIRDMRANFRGDVWGNNGPGVITRTLQKLCSTKYVRDMTTSRCHGFKVFSPSTFYPIHYEKWKIYFETKDKNTTMQIVDKAMAIHVWNKFSKFEKVDVNNDVPYVIIARKHCPKIFNNCGKIF